MDLVEKEIGVVLITKPQAQAEEAIFASCMREICEKA
jgi:hypothetical protein